MCCDLAVQVMQHFVYESTHSVCTYVLHVCNLIEIRTH